jgi:hypothetical protein
MTFQPLIKKEYLVFNPSTHPINSHIQAPRFAVSLHQILTPLLPVLQLGKHSAQETPSFQTLRLATGGEEGEE